MAIEVLKVQWIGADTSQWNLTDLTSTVQLVAIDGLGTPTFSQQFTASGARDGRRYEGTLYNQSNLTMTVTVGDVTPLPGRKRRRTGDEWRALDRAWRKSVSPETTGTLVLTTSAGSRKIQLRLDQPFSIPPSQDPAIIGEATYTLVMTADDQPWWEGEPVPAEFTQGAAAQPFFGGNDGATLLFISESNQLAESELLNPGDRPAYPQWWARGPFTSAVVGVDGKVVRLPFSRIAGQYVYVDSSKGTIIDENGQSLWPLMGFTDPTFAGIEPNEAVSLTTSLEGGESTSAIGVSIVPLYEGPW